MVARVLVVNEYNVDVSRICNTLENSYNALLFARSIEDAIRIVGSQYIDLVLVYVPSTQSKLLIDFLGVLRQLCSIIPIIGVVGKNITEFVRQCASIGLDDLINISINKDTLLRKVDVYVQMRNVFDDNLFNNNYFGEEYKKKIVTIFHPDVNFVHNCVDKSTKILALQSWPAIEDVNDADLFVINVDNPRAYQCGASIRLRKSCKYKPVLFSYDKISKSQIKAMTELNIVFVDALSVATDPTIVSCRINSLIRYKKLYEYFSQNIKKNMYQSAIDPTTGVFNRAFFEDYVKNHNKRLSNTAILMIDIDKFKMINDHFGHSFADKMLKYVSNTIKMYVRSSDVIARYGGDEFVIIIDNISQSSAFNIACRIQRTIESSPFKDSSCTVSIGICCIQAEGTLAIEEAIFIADKFMYIAKQNGGNSVRMCA